MDKIIIFIGSGFVPDSIFEVDIPVGFVVMCNSNQVGQEKIVEFMENYISKFKKDFPGIKNLSIRQSVINAV